MKTILILLFTFSIITFCKTQAPVAALSPNENNYFNFTIGVDEALFASRENGDGSRDGLKNGASGTTFYGVANILAIVNENLWPVSVPDFEGVLNTARGLPEAYEEILSKILGPSIKITNTVFTPDTLPDSASLKKLKADVKKVDFQASDATGQINSDISTKIACFITMPYIPPKATLPQSAKAIIISIVELSAEWPTPLAKIGTGQFNGAESVDMYEIVGAFPYLESDDALQVTIPFKNDERALVLILPTDINAALRGEIAEPHNGTAKTVKVHIPLFDYTVQSSHKAEKTRSTCDWKKSPNFFRVLYDVVRISTTVDKFEATSITGGIINIVDQFKKEVEGSQKSQQPLSSANPTTIDSNKISPSPSARNDVVNANEKVIVVDRSFQWRIDDAYMGPLFFGTVESVKQSNDLASDDTTDVFGLDSLPYISCL